jgi:hypothetical protein
MKKGRFLPWMLATGLILFAPMAMAGDKNKNKDRERERISGADHTLFDGTNPNNQPSSGAVCGAFGADRKGHLTLTDKPFTWHVSVSNFSFSDAVLRIIYQDGDFTHYHVAANSSFSLSQAGGGKGNRAIRAWVETPQIGGVNGSNSGGGQGSGELAGEASILGDGVFCISCDADSAGDAACDRIIKN